jgi:hypothetical protein
MSIGEMERLRRVVLFLYSQGLRPIVFVVFMPIDLADFGGHEEYPRVAVVWFASGNHTGADWHIGLRMACHSYPDQPTPVPQAVQTTATLGYSS